MTGLCPRCGRPAYGGHVLCPACFRRLWLRWLKTGA